MAMGMTILGMAETVAGHRGATEGDVGDAGTFRPGPGGRLLGKCGAGIDNAEPAGAIQSYISHGVGLGSARSAL